MDYMHIVFVDRPGGHRLMCEAPSWPYLNEGDKVLHETTDGVDCEGTCATKSIMMGGEELETVIKGWAAPVPLLRVTGRIEVNRFEYEKAASAENTGDPVDG